MTVFIKYALIGCWIAITAVGVVLFIVTDFDGFLAILKVSVAILALSVVAGSIMGIKQGLEDIKKAKKFPS